MRFYNFLQTLRSYVFFQFLFLLIFLILISFVTFFHFTLDHSFSIIESWIRDNTWEIVIAAKAVSFFLFNKFYLVKYSQHHWLKEILNQRILPGRGFYVLVSFWFIMTVMFVRLESNPDFFWFKIALQYVGNILYFGSDFLICSYALYRYQNKIPLFNFLLYTSVYTLVFSYVTYLLSPAPFIFIFFGAVQFLILFVFFYTKRDWFSSLVFVIIYIAPISCFFGYDIFWTDLYSMFRSEEGLARAPVASLLIMSCCYIYYKNRRTRSGKALI